MVNYHDFPTDPETWPVRARANLATLRCRANRQTGPVRSERGSSFNARSTVGDQGPGDLGGLEFQDPAIPKQQVSIGRVVGYPEIRNKYETITIVTPKNYPSPWSPIITNHTKHFKWPKYVGPTRSSVPFNPDLPNGISKLKVREVPKFVALRGRQQRQQRYIQHTCRKTAGFCLCHSLRSM